MRLFIVLLIATSYAAEISLIHELSPLTFTLTTPAQVKVSKMMDLEPYVAYSDGMTKDLDRFELAHALAHIREGFVLGKPLFVQYNNDEAVLQITPIRVRQYHVLVSALGAYGSNARRRVDQGAEKILMAKSIKEILAIFHWAKLDEHKFINWDGR